MAGKSSFRVTVVVLRVCVGVLLLYTGGEKLFRLDDFTRDVANYRMVMPPWDAVVAYMLPCFELLTGVCLLVGVLVRGALLLAAGMTAMFMLGIGQAMAFGLNINCGCFGADDEASNMPLHMVFLAVMFVVIMFLFIADRPSRSHVFGGRRLKLPGM